MTHLMLVQSHPRCRPGVVRSALFGAVFALALLLPGIASAATSSLVVNTLKPTLEKGEDGGSKVALSFTNLTDGPVVLSAAASGQPKCVLGLSTNQLPPAQISAVTVEIPPTCDRGESLNFTISAASSGGALPSFQIDPEGEPAEKPDWNQLYAFVAALLGSAIFLVVFFFTLWEPSPGAERRLAQPLKSVDVATWKLTDNWATNVTAVGALLTGIFGASTSKAFLGEDAESAVALATVGAALALALVAVGPVVLVATKRLTPKFSKHRDGSKGERTGSDNYFTVGGLLAAAAFVLASAYGQLWVVMETGMELDLGGVEDLLPVPVAFAAGLLLLYAWRSLKDLLESGTMEPKTKKEVEIRAADVIARAIKAEAGDDEEEPHRDRGLVAEPVYFERRSPML